MVLSREQTKSYYDRFGKKQDTQAFYEDAAFDELVARAGFETAERVFELACGTGRFASRLLEKHLPESATYLGIDLSETMVRIARQRLAAFGSRAQVMHSDGSMKFPAEDRSVDRIVAAYVLDLLSVDEQKAAVDEACRVLKPGGKLGVVSLTVGPTPLSRAVTALWSTVYRFRASLVGGCRPIHLEPLFESDRWTLEYRSVVVRFGMPSEVCVVSRA